MHEVHRHALVQDSGAAVAAESARDQAVQRVALHARTDVAQAHAARRPGGRPAAAAPRPGARCILPGHFAHPQVRLVLHSALHHVEIASLHIR